MSSSTVKVSISGGWSDADLPPGPWSGSLASCATVGGSLVVAVANETASSCALYLSSLPSLPGNASSPTWTSIASYGGGGSLSGFAVTKSGLEVYLAVLGVGVVKGSRASAGSTAFTGWSVNTALGLGVTDVLLSATDRAIYGMSAWQLSVIDLARISDMGGTWASATAYSVASAPSSSRFAGLSLSST